MGKDAHRSRSLLPASLVVPEQPARISVVQWQDRRFQTGQSGFESLRWCHDPHDRLVVFDGPFESDGAWVSVEQPDTLN